MIHADLLRAILDNPHDDAPRLITADWLDEQERQETCANCNGRGEERFCDAAGDMDDTPCTACGGSLDGGYKRGSGVVSNGAAARAEFIRVQCELARIECDGGDCGHLGVYCEGCCRRDTFRSRESKLFASTSAFLSLTEFLPGQPIDYMLHGTSCRRRIGDETAIFVFNRGFIGHVELSCDEFVGRQCERCGGDGKLQSYYSSGGTRLISPISHDCQYCSGTGSFSGIAERLFKACPVTSVVLSDKRPYWNGAGHTWYNIERLNARLEVPAEANLPRVLFNELSRVKHQLNRWEAFKTEQLALAALSAACVAYGRRLAGLPEMTRATAEIHSMA